MIAESLRSERGRKILEGIYTRTRVSGYIEHPDSDSSFVSLLYNFFVDFAKLSLERRWRHCPQGCRFDVSSSVPARSSPPTKG